MDGWPRLNRGSIRRAYCKVLRTSVYAPRRAFQIGDVVAQFTGLLVLCSVTLQRVLVKLARKLEPRVFDNCRTPR